MATQEMPNVLLYVARVLQDQLSDLLSGATEAPGLRTTLEFASQHILVSQNAASGASTCVAMTDRRPRRRLHGHSSSDAHPRAVQLSVDPETKHYKVIVVGTYRNIMAQNATDASVYHFRTQFWSCFDDSSNIVLGCSHSCVRGQLDGPNIPHGSWTYDAANGKRCQDGKLGHHKIRVPCTSGRTKATLISSAVTNGRGFHLQRIEGIQGYRILKFFIMHGL